MLHTNIIENQENSANIVAQIATTAWSDGMVAARLKSDCNEAVRGLCEDLEYHGPISLDLQTSLTRSPVGDVPFEGVTFIMATTESNCATDSCGTVYSLTAECGCSDTTTGECACFTIWGTMCRTCS